MKKHENTNLQNIVNLLTLNIGMFFAVFYLDIFSEYSTIEKILIAIFGIVVLYFAVIIPLAKFNKKTD